MKKKQSIDTCSKGNKNKTTPKFPKTHHFDIVPDNISENKISGAKGSNEKQQNNTFLAPPTPKKTVPFSCGPIEASRPWRGGFKSWGVWGQGQLDCMVSGRYPLGSLNSKSSPPWIFYTIPLKERVFQPSWISGAKPCSTSGLVSSWWSKFSPEASSGIPLVGGFSGFFWGGVNGGKQIHGPFCPLSPGK